MGLRSIPAILSITMLMFISDGGFFTNPTVGYSGFFTNPTVGYGGFFKNPTVGYDGSFSRILPCSL